MVGTLELSPGLLHINLPTRSLLTTRWVPSLLEALPPSFRMSLVTLSFASSKDSFFAFPLPFWTSWLGRARTWFARVLAARRIWIWCSWLTRDVAAMEKPGAHPVCFLYVVVTPPARYMSGGLFARLCCLAVLILIVLQVACCGGYSLSHLALVG